MHPHDAAALLEVAYDAEQAADGLCAGQDIAAAARTTLGPSTCSSRATPCSARWRDADDAGLLAACRVLYKKAGCCLLLDREDDALDLSKQVLRAAGNALERDCGGGGPEVFGPGGAKAMYCWVQALHALQHLAQACPEAAEEQAQMQAGSAAADGRRLVDVPLPAPGDLPPAAAAAAVQDGAAHEVLCSSAALMESAAGFVVRSRSGCTGVQLDRWHVRLPVVQGADAQQLRLQPLGPLLAAYMAQRWQQAPGAELPRAAPGGEGSSDEGF